MDGGAWWAHGAAKSQTRLSNFTFSEGKGAADLILQVFLQDIWIWTGGWRMSRVGFVQEQEYVCKLEGQLGAQQGWRGCSQGSRSRVSCCILEGSLWPP